MVIPWSAEVTSPFFLHLNVELHTLQFNLFLFFSFFCKFGAMIPVSLVKGPVILCLSSVVGRLRILEGSVIANRVYREDY